MIRNTPTKLWISSLFNHLLRKKRWHVITDLINYYGFSKYAEIGVDLAQTTDYVVKHCQLDTIIAVDNYPLYEGVTQSEADKRYEIAKAKLHDKAGLWKVTSEEASKSVEDESLDIVFLDANHRYESIKQDIKLWLPKIRKGGILIGHDYSLRSLGVVNAVTEIFGYFQISDDNTWWVMKK